MSIKIDGIPISQYNLKCELSHDHPALPGTRDYTEQIPGMFGAYDYGADMSVKEFSLPMKIENVNSNSELALAMREFTKALLDPTGRPKTVKLSFDYEPEKWYMARYSGSMPLDRLVYRGLFTLPLTAFDPAAYALSSAYDSNQDYNGDDVYNGESYYPNTQSFNWIYTKHYTGVYNHSFYESPMKFIIKGACLNPKITHTETGKTLTLTETLSSTDEVIIDSKAFTIVKNKTVNLLRKYSGDFFQLVEGNNSFVFESETVPNAVVTLDWNHRFM